MSIMNREQLDEMWDAMSNGDTRICVFCDNATQSFSCRLCGEYKGLMTISQWEEYTGEVWED